MYLSKNQEKSVAIRQLITTNPNGFVYYLHLHIFVMWGYSQRWQFDICPLILTYALVPFLSFSLSHFRWALFDECKNSLVCRLNRCRLVSTAYTPHIKRERALFRHHEWQGWTNVKVCALKIYRCTTVQIAWNGKTSMSACVIGREWIELRLRDGERQRDEFDENGWEMFVNRIKIVEFLFVVSFFFPSCVLCEFKFVLTVGCCSCCCRQGQ